MRNSKYRRFDKNIPIHVYTKATNGFVIFYSLEDCLYYFTLYSCKSKKYNIRTLAFDIMPNHMHSNEQCEDWVTFYRFHDALESEFANGYNRRHGRKGNLFKIKFGFAPKTIVKKVKDNLCYISNNHVAGRMSDSVLADRWNLLAYFNNDHPFSEKIELSKCSRRMRRTVKMVKIYRNNDQPLTYERQHEIFEGLTQKETAQIVDYVISQYNFLDYASLASFYDNSMEKALLVFESNSGSEHELKEDFENYGHYNSMIRICKRMGYDMRVCNFERISIDEAELLIQNLSSTGATEKQIFKFLHIKYLPCR